MDDIEGIERATFAAMPPQRLEARGDWLLGLDDGTVGRSHSAVPIRLVMRQPSAVRFSSSVYQPPISRKGLGARSLRTCWAMK